MLTQQAAEHLILNHTLLPEPDLAALNELHSHLVQLVKPEDEARPEKTSQAYYHFSNVLLSTRTHDGRSLRITVLNREALLEIRPLHFVGFFGQKRPTIEPELQSRVARLDMGLLRKLERFPSLLSYCSVELPDRYNYANLVIFSQPTEIEQWKARNRLHRIASQEASPGYYNSVRIHTGVMKLGLFSSTFTGVSTKHYDFGSFSS